jgi:membrane protease YdiL (CAAX protease family)
MTTTTHSPPSSTPEHPGAVASYGHTLGLVGIAAVVAALGALAQARPTTGGGLTSTHASALPAYVSALVMEALLVGYVWAGVRKRGVSLAVLSGGRWSSLREVMRDVAIAIPFWIVWQAAASLADALIGPSNAKSISVLLPIGALEVSAWIMVSVIAGIVEELVFRGYLQRQLAALSGRISIAVLGQAAVFGLMHAYQGWKAVSVICFLGALFGVVAAWRRSTRPGMIVHAMADIWGGWLKGALHFPY